MARRAVNDRRGDLTKLLERARQASPNDRIELRDPIAAHGADAVAAMGEWLADPILTRFAVRVVGRVADVGERDAKVSALSMAREDATPDQRTDIDAELRRLGASPGRSRRRERRASQSMDPSVPGWMMRTDRSNADWIWSEVEAGRLRQGWGYQPKQNLFLLRDRRERGESMDRDDDWAWPNRRMLSDEPDGMQAGDLVFLPHLPHDWRWSLVRITGPYRFEIRAGRTDHGHILPVEVLAADLGDEELTDELRWMRTYPARLRRLTLRAYEDLRRLVAIDGLYGSLPMDEPVEDHLERTRGQ